MSSKKFVGTQGSLGIAFAKALVIEDDQEIKIREDKPTKSSDEVIAFKDALSLLVNSLEKQAKKTEKLQKKENAAVILAHVQILKDPIVSEEIIDLIKKDNLRSDKAVSIIMNKYFEMFNAMDDEYFKERSKDIKDVYTQLIKKILGIKSVNLGEIDEEVIIIATELTPSQTSQLNPNFIKGFVTETGGATSHAALMAQNMGIPALLGVKKVTKTVKNNDMLILNAALEGYIIVSPTKEEVTEAQRKIKEDEEMKVIFEQFRGKESKTKDGESFTLLANIGDEKDAKDAFLNDAEGIGLFRSEFLYMKNTETLPSEEMQFKAYKSVLETMKDKPVTIRTLDIGGDKEIETFQIDKEMNPFLGYRAVRICLDRTDIFKTQLRALFRASVFGQLKIMIPFISTYEEVKSVEKIVNIVKKELESEKKDFRKDIKIGIMVEIPSSIWMADVFSKELDFFSIGTNDLVQYTFAIDRMNEKVSNVADYLNPALLRSLDYLVKKAPNYEISMCGQMASDTIALPILIGLGIRKLSMSSNLIINRRFLMSRISEGKAKKTVAEILANAKTRKDVVDIVLKNHKEEIV